MPRLMHEGHSIESRGPWSFATIRDDDLAAGEDGMIRRELPCGITLITKPGGTCDRCMRAITYIVILENVDGNTVNVGADCADFLLADEEGKKMIRRVNAELRAALNHERRVHAFEASRAARASSRAERIAARAVEVEAHRATMAPELAKAQFVLDGCAPGYAQTIITKFVATINYGDLPPSWMFDVLDRFYARAKRPSNPIGVVGERVAVEGVVTRVHCLDRAEGTPRWNTKYLVEITTDAGDVVVLFAFWRAVLDGALIEHDKVAMTVEVREHKSTGTATNDTDTIVSKPKQMATLAQHIPTWHPASNQEN